MKTMLLADTHRVRRGEVQRWDRRTAAWRHMTAEELLHLGTHQVVCLKAGMCDGEMRFVLYGADRTTLAMAEDVETAVETAAEHGPGFGSVD